jgi:4-carboxymuconolactone decarboxylase
MNFIVKTLALLLFLSGCSQRETPMSTARTDAAPEPNSPSAMEAVRAVSPALAAYADRAIAGEVWKRPGLSPRDRSIVTISVLIARNQPIDLPEQFELALSNGVKPAELSEIITHLAFYSGWSNASSAAVAARRVFDGHGIDAAQLPAADPNQRLPLDEAAETARDQRVSQDFGSVAPGVVQYTRDLLFRDLWLRPDLAPGDRSLVTVSALVASGQVAQVTYHLNRAMGNGLTQGGLRGADTARILCGLAECVLGIAGLQGSVRFAREQGGWRINKRNQDMTIGKWLAPTMFVFAVAMFAVSDSVRAQEEGQMVRLSKLVIDPARARSADVVCGAEKDRPTHFTILEIYADRSAYEKHIESPHFIEYKTGTQHMVKSLELIDTVPLVPEMKIK